MCVYQLELDLSTHYVVKYKQCQGYQQDLASMILVLILFLEELMVYSEISKDRVKRMKFYVWILLSIWANFCSNMIYFQSLVDNDFSAIIAFTFYFFYCIFAMKNFYNNFFNIFGLILFAIYSHKCVCVEIFKFLNKKKQFIFHYNFL